MKHPPSHRLLHLILLCVTLSALPASAVPGAAKLGPRPANGVVNGLHGYAVAVNERFAVVSEPFGNQRRPSGGAVHVYTAKTGRFLRSLIPADLADDQRFGLVLALHGNLLAVGGGASDAALRTVYLFDLRNGKLLRKLTPQSQAIPESFGSSLALTAEAVFVGAKGDNSDRGAVFVFDTVTGFEKAKFTSSSSAPDDQLGSSLAVAGDVLFAGAPGALSTTGAVVLFNWRQNVEITQLTLTPPNPGVFLGYALAVVGDMLYASAPVADSNNGQVYAFNWVQGSMQLFAPPVGRKYFGYSLAAERGILAVGELADPGVPGTVTLLDGDNGQVLDTLTGEQAGDLCGSAVALFGGRLLIGAPNHDLPPALVSNSGAAYLIQTPAARKLPMTQLMAAKTPANGGGQFRRLGDAFINPAGQSIANASLSAATPASANAGVWAEYSMPSTPELVARKGYNANGDATGNEPRATKVDFPLMNRHSHALVRLTFPGRYEGIFKGDGTGALTALLPQNTGLGLFNGARIGKYLDLSQSTFVPPFVLGDPGSFAARYQLANHSGAGAINKGNDSGVLIAGSGSFLGPVAPILLSSTREGEPGPIGTTYREFGPMVAHSSRDVAFWARFSGPAPLGERPGVFRVALNDQNDPNDDVTTLIADSNAVILPGTVDTELRTFISVGLQPGLFEDATLFRATLKGPGVSSKNNEVVWHETEQVILRKGDQVPTEPVAPRVWNRVLGVWPAGGLHRVIVMARIKGAGVNASNDVGVWLLDDDGVAKVLLKEGQRLALPDAPQVGVISRVDVSPGGRYVILASVTGTAAARNQMLFTGDASAGTLFSERVAQTPAQPVLRKGDRFTHPFFVNPPVALKSISLSQVLGAGGMGGRGKGQVVNSSGNVVVKLRVGSQDVLMSGLP